MPLGSFLDRIVAPGNYLALAFQGKQGLWHRFFSRDRTDFAVSYCHWASDTKKIDVWYAPASFKEITEQIDDRSFKGRRTKENTQALKAFWMDADIKRVGDNKDPSKVFADKAELVRWVKGFSQATGIPLPNLWVCSGYGVHLYWTFADALDRLTWQPYADALKAQLVAHGAKGDLGVVGDAARILRPIGTFNYKVPTSPAPTSYLIDQPDYANADLLPRLATTGSVGRRPSAAKPTTLAANAQAGLTAAPRDFSTIALACPQVALSLAEGGTNDGRQLWRAMLTLARFCENGRDWAHVIGQDHPDYKPDDTDAEFDLIEKEWQDKKFGATLCSTFNAERTGICATCPHNGKITSPYALGLQAAPTDPEQLPNGYRCLNGFIERNGENGWHRILRGEFKNPLFDFVGSEARLTFDHEVRRSNGSLKTTRMTFTHGELLTARPSIVLAQRGMIVQSNRSGIPEMLMAWMDQLRDACRDRGETLPAFGWYHEGTSNGFAVAGKFYSADGTVHEALCPPDILQRYPVKGSVDKWRDAAAFVIGKHPSLHVALAVSFAAPLMKYTGEVGGCVSFVGPSGVGKTSVFRAGAAVWGHPKTSIAQVDDTENYRMKILGQVNALPVFWDEARLASKEGVERYLTMLLKLTQGRDKGRLGSDLNMREAGTWETIYALASNTSVTELLAQREGYKSAAMLRTLEIQLTHRFTLAPGAGTVVASLDRNHGCAGHEYARYLATRHHQLEDFYKRVHEQMIARLKGGDPEERFHIALAACIVAGACLAQKALAVPFDIQGIIEVLVAAIRFARLDRTEVEPSGNQQVGEVLRRFLAERADGVITTAHIKGPGAGTPSLTRELLPAAKIDSVPCVQIAVDDKRLRLDKAAFRQWCGLKVISANQMFDLMHSRWGATGAERGARDRGHIGAGAKWRTKSTVFVVDINLDQFELHDVLDSAAEMLRPNPLPVVTGNVVALPARQPLTPPTP